MRKLLHSRLAMLLFAFIVIGAPAVAQYSVNIFHKPPGEGLTPTVGDAEGVWSFEGNTPPDTITLYPVPVRGATQVHWLLQASASTVSPCSLIAMQVSNNNVDWLAIGSETIGGSVTIRSGATNVRLDQGGRWFTAYSADSNGSGGIRMGRMPWLSSRLVLTKKGGTAGQMDSLRSTAYVWY